ncbi:hypothetical protein AAG906_027431 [Vitis piasezkii]
MQKVPYASAVGSLMYAMVCTRPILLIFVGITCLCFGTDKLVLVGCTNADMVGNAEYIAIIEPSKDLLWMKKFLQELGLQQERYLLYCDSQSVIHLSNNPTFHFRSKHIDVRYHWIHDALEMKFFALRKSIDEDGSDMMTKPIPIEKLQFHRKQTGLVEPFT